MGRSRSGQAEEQDEGLLAVDQSQDAQVTARFLEAVQLPRGAALSIVYATEVPDVAIRFPGQLLMLTDWRKKKQRLTRVD